MCVEDEDTLKTHIAVLAASVKSLSGLLLEAFSARWVFKRVVYKFCAKIWPVDYFQVCATARDNLETLALSDWRNGCEMTARSPSVSRLC